MDLIQEFFWPGLYAFTRLVRSAFKELRSALDGCLDDW